MTNAAQPGTTNDAERRRENTMLDPGIAEMLKKMQEAGEPPLFKDVTAEEARRRGERVRSKYYPPVLLDVAGVEDRRIPGPGGEIPVRVYRPLGAGTGATVIYLHGGGWIIGDLESHDGHARRVAHTVGAVVVHVDYRLAPENPFPAGYDDCVAATRWIFEHVDELGGDGEKIAVAGDSAGGNLTAAVALQCRDAGLPLAAQLLIYPATDLEGSLRGIYANASDDADGGFFTGENDAWIEQQYLGDDLSQARDLRVSPLHAGSLVGVAPTVIGVGAYDPLRPQCLAYAEALRLDGVPVVVREYPGLIHGFFGMGSISEAAEQAADELCRDLAHLLTEAGSVVNRYTPVDR